jgi:hypothetical protein
MAFAQTYNTVLQERSHLKQKNFIINQKETTLPLPPLEKVIKSVHSPEPLPTLAMATIQMAMWEDTTVCLQAQPVKQIDHRRRLKHTKTVPLNLHSPVLGIVVIGLVFLLLLVIGMMLTMLLLGHSYL